MSEWQQYADATVRETYPPLPKSGGNPNKEASDAISGMIVSQHTAAVQQEAEFRERQRQRRLQTRGREAMREPEESLPQPIVELPDDPALDEYKAAGWLG